jgi:Uma2 family endonuclease
MSPATRSAPDDELVELALSARRFTRDQYYKMLDSGIFAEGDPVELVEGYILEKPVRKPSHETTLRRLDNRIRRFLPAAGWFFQCQGVVSLPADNEPEPDGVVLRGEDADYDGRIPGAADVALAIGVSDSSRSIDRRIKGRAYARAGIPVYWLINVVDRVFEVYADPDPAAAPPSYRTRTDYRPGQDVPLVLDGVTVGSSSAAGLLP